MALSLPGNDFLKRFTPLFAAGTVGVVSLVPLLLPQVQKLAQAREQPVPPTPTLATLLAVQPTLLTAAAVAAGVALAPRLGLRSHVADNAAAGRSLLAGLHEEAPHAVGLGLVASLGTIGLDHLFRPYMREAWEAMNAATPHDLTGTVAGVLYGGITEELLVRWGLMTGIAWLLWRTVQEEQGTPRPWIMGGAIGAAALLFGMLHLPATAAITRLTPVVVVRGLLLNGIVGMLAGWLYWRRSLEAAMMSHATYHVTVAALMMSGLVEAGGEEA